MHAFVYREEAYIHPAGVQIINHLFKERDEEEPQRNWGIIRTIAIWRVHLALHTNQGIKCVQRYIGKPPYSLHHIL